MTSSSFDPSKIAINHGLSWYTKQEGLSEECKGYLERMTYDDTLARAFFNQATSTQYTIGSEKCGQGTMGQISTQIQKFFIFLKGLKKYNDLYIQGSINKVANLQSNIHKTATAVAGVLRTIIQRTRNWVLNKIKALVRNALDYFLTPIVKQAKEAVVDLMLDQIFCAFDRIIDGLVDLVGDFLYSLIGTVVNAPFCVAERWANALIGRVVSDIDKALSPLFNQINDLLGGVAKVAGSVMNVVNTILGFEGFFCKTPECPEVHDFQVSPWGGPTDTMKTNWNNFDFDAQFTDAEWFDGFLGEEGNSSQSPGACYTGEFECGVPQIVIFGGGGSGAVAQAVVNKIGQVIGSNVLNGGEGYYAPPFVSIIDPAGCGSNAAAYSVINDEGEVIEIVITSPGMDYDNTAIGGAPIITSFVGAPNPVQIGKTVIFSWAVNNADTVSISHPGFEGLPLIGSVAIPITADMVILPPGAQTTTLTFTLTAKKNNKDSAEQITTKDFILTVSSGKVADEKIVDYMPPDILSFAVSPATASPEDFVSITWEAEHVTKVSLKGSYIWNNLVYDTKEVDFPSLPDEGAVSFLLPPAGNHPDGIEFAQGEGSAIRSYTITAVNINAPVNDTGATNTLSITSDLTILKAPAIADPPTSDDEAGAGEIINPGLPADGTQLVDMTDDGGVSIQITDTDSGTTTTIDPEDDEGGVSGSTDNAVSIIGDIDILNTGIGYSPSDTVIISDGGGGSSTDDSANDGNNGASASISVNDIGQIVDIKLESSGYGFTKIPFISIGSKTGAGAEFRSKLKFIPVSQLLDDQDLQTVDPNKLVQVIDCPDKPLTVKIL